MKLTCNDLLDYLSEYIDGNLDQALDAAAKEHLATCKNCSVILDSTEKTIALYKSHTAQQVLEGNRYRDLYNQIEAAFDAALTDS